MPKLIDFLRTLPPSLSLYTFADPVTVFDDDGNMVYTTPFAKTTPNGVKPKSPKSKSSCWDAWYGCIALGTYNGLCDEDDEHGKCIRLLGDIPTILPNPAQKFWHVARGILIHSSESNTWAGSAGCITVRKSEWKQFITHFKIGEKVRIQLRGVR